MTSLAALHTRGMQNVNGTRNVEHEGSVDRAQDGASIKRTVTRLRARLSLSLEKPSQERPGMSR